MYSRTLAIAVSSAVLLVTALLLFSCSGFASADQPMTTPPALGIAMTEGQAALEDFGDAVISYLGGKTDLGAVQALVVPSAREDLAQMLSSLGHPTRFRVTGAGAEGDATQVDNDVLFLGGGSAPAEFTITIAVDQDKQTIMVVAIRSGRTGLLAPAGATSSLPLYPYPMTSFIIADANVLATVTEALPMRANPLAGAPGTPGQNERQPVAYKAYVLEVQKAYGPDTVPKKITVYALALDATPGDRLLLPLVKYTPFGTPGLKDEEYWVEADYAVFAVDAFNDCKPVTGADMIGDTRTEFSLAELEEMAAGQGRPDAPTVTAPLTTIVDASAAGSSHPIILIEEPRDLELMSNMASFSSADAIVLATVTEVLPLRRNKGEPIVYKGYVLQVEKAYRPDGIPKQITVYALGNGTIELDGVTYEVREKYPLDARPGDKFLVPLVKTAYFGTPGLKEDEYWVQANWTVWAVDASGTARRVTAIDSESPNEFPLAELERMIVEEGRPQPN